MREVKHLPFVQCFHDLGPLRALTCIGQ
jgi:hypothetical protein